MKDFSLCKMYRTVPNPWSFGTRMYHDSAFPLYLGLYIFCFFFNESLVSNGALVFNYY